MKNEGLQELKIDSRNLKIETAKFLQLNRVRYVEDYPHIWVTDGRLMEYIMEVIDHPNDHNLYELLKVKRFFGMCNKYQWNGDSVADFIDFYETTKFSGADGRRCYELTGVQVFQYASIFGFEREEGVRLTRTAYIFVPRKFSKTTSAAALAVYDLLYGDNNAEAYIGANSYDQAKKCFDEVRAIMFDREKNKTHKSFRINREKITYEKGVRDSLVQCLTANAKTKDGLSASLAILDEYAQARNTKSKNGADLKYVLTTSMATRKNPLTVIITTASDVFDGPFYEELENVKKILRGEAENDTIFADLFMPDVDDEEGDPHTWRKVQPHMGITVRDDFYQLAWQDAQLSAEAMMAFRTKMLNIFAVNERKAWFTPQEAQALIGDFEIGPAVKGYECAVAFDLSVHDDFSAVSYTFYHTRLKRFYCHTDYYLPEGAIEGHPNEQLYRKWHEQGYLKFCQGNVIDVRMIANDILARSRYLKIVRVGYDAYKSQELVNILSAQRGGREALTPFKQTYGAFNLAVEEFESLARQPIPKIVFNDNPINTYCLCNCYLDSDNLENKKPIKMNANRKIDGAVTAIMCVGLLYSYKRPV